MQLHARRWVQPTLEIIGMQGGHTTNGTRGVVVSKAFAKIMCRLIPDQNASAVLEAMHQHVASHAPPHTKFTVTAVASHGRLLTEPYFIPKDAPGNAAAAKVINTSWTCLLTKVWHFLTGVAASELLQRLAPKCRAFTGTVWDAQVQSPLLFWFVPYTGLTASKMRLLAQCRCWRSCMSSLCCGTGRGTQSLYSTSLRSTWD